MFEVICFRRRWKIAMFGIAMLMAARAATAQAFEVARRGSEITFFGEGLYLKPDSGSSSNTGFVTGVDVTPVLTLLLQPSLEIRFTSGSGEMNTEKTISAGVKLAARIHGFHPYGIYQQGFGFIYFKHPTITPGQKPYTQDNSPMHVEGGGMEIDVRSLWQIRGEVTQQYWNLDPPVIRPLTVSVGVTYRLPFHNGQMK